LTASKWWTNLLATYLGDYHPLLRHGIEHEFVFMTRQGTPFTAPYFSEFLSSLLFRHTGQRVAVNMLRSSFVTHFYSSDAAHDPVMRESVATVMRHSVDQALKMYDRRSTASKKHKGLELLASHHQHRSSVVIEKSSLPTVILFQRVPHQVIREEEANGVRLLLLGKMMRSLSSNTPAYFLPADAVFHLQPRDHCIVLEGKWHEENGEFALKINE
jgi:hypothetical protein